MYLSPHISVALCEFVIYVTRDSCFCKLYIYTCFLNHDSCLFSPIPEFCFLRISVSLVICFLVGFFVPYYLDSLLPLPPVVSSLCVLVLVFFYVRCYSDFPASTLICSPGDSVYGSPLELTCHVSDPCLCLTLISACSSNKSLVSLPLPCVSGSFPTHPFTVRNKKIIHGNQIQQGQSKIVVGENTAKKGRTRKSKWQK